MRRTTYCIGAGFFATLRLAITPALPKPNAAQEAATEWKKIIVQTNEARCAAEKQERANQCQLDAAAQTGLRSLYQLLTR